MAFNFSFAPAGASAAPADAAPAFSFDFSSLSSAANAANAAAPTFTFAAAPVPEKKKTAKFAELSEIERLRLAAEALRDEAALNEKRLAALEREDREQGKIFELTAAALHPEDEKEFKEHLKKEIDAYVQAKVQLPEALRKAATTATGDDLEVLLGATRFNAEKADFYGAANSEPSSDDEDDDAADHCGDENCTDSSCGPKHNHGGAGKSCCDDDHCHENKKGGKKAPAGRSAPEPEPEPEKPEHVPDQKLIAEWRKQIADLESEVASLPGKKNYPKRKKLNEKIAELQDMVESELNGPDSDDEGDEMDEMDEELQEQISEMSERLAEIEEEMDSLRGAKHAKARAALKREFDALQQELLDLLEAAGIDVADDSDDEGEGLGPRGNNKGQQKGGKQQQQQQQPQKQQPQGNKNAKPEPVAAPVPAPQAAQPRSGPGDKKPVAQPAAAEAKPAAKVSKKKSAKKSEKADDDVVELDTSTAKLAAKIADAANAGGKVDIASLIDDPEKLAALLQSMNLEQEHSDDEGDDDGEGDEGDDDNHSNASSDWDKFPYEENLFALSRFFQFVSRVDTERHMVIYKAVDLDTGKWAMVKIVDFLPADKKTPKEVKILTALQTSTQPDASRVPQLVAWFPLEGTECHAIATNFFKCESIEDTVLGNPEKMQQYMKGVLEALVYVHSKNVIFRDVRPGNMGWDSATGQLTLLNFEDSTFFDPVRKHRADVGYDGYQAPEILQLAGAAALRRRAEKDAQAKIADKAKAAKVQVVVDGEADEEAEAEEEKKRLNAAREKARNELPPEGGYGPEVDVYSAGVVFGQLIFCAREDDVTNPEMEEIKGPGFLRRLAEIRKEGNVSRLTPAHDLLEKLLNEDPAKRISAKDALAHPYFSTAPTLKDIIPETASASVLEDDEDDEDEAESGDDQEYEPQNDDNDLD